MLVIISDLHLGDGTTASSIAPGAFRLFSNRLRETAYYASFRRDGMYRPIDRLDLVLMGDVLDPLPQCRNGDWKDGQTEIEVLAELMRALHEFGPDRQGGMRTFEPQLAVVVKAHPDCANQLGRKANEPAVVRRAGLARSRHIEAARADGGER